MLGVGSELRGDDVCGLLIARCLKKNLKGFRRKEIKVFFGDTAPENFTGELRRFNPSHTIIIDSAQMGKQVGAVKVLSQKELRGASFCTHKLPMEVLATYLRESIGCRVIVLGIQPAKIDFGIYFSKEVHQATRYVCSAIKAALRNC